MKYKVLASFHFTLAAFQLAMFGIHNYVTGPKFQTMFLELGVEQSFGQLYFVWIIFALSLGNLLFVYLNLSSKTLNKENTFAIGLSYMFLSLFISAGLMVYGSILPVYQVVGSL